MISRRSYRSVAVLLTCAASHAQTTTCASLATSGSVGDTHSRHPAISADGRRVVFESRSTSFDGASPTAVQQIFVRDRWSGTLACVSRGALGPADLPCSAASISSDGRYVAFSSAATNLVAGVAGMSQVYVADLTTGALEVVSRSPGGAPGDGPSGFASLSADGRYVAFAGGATNLVAADVNGRNDVFVRDRALGTTELVSVGPGGVQGDDFSTGSVLSTDGRYVAFYAAATNLIAGDTNGLFDVFVRDRASGTTERVSVSSSAVQGDNHSFDGSLSDDGRFVAFHSQASNLVPNDTNPQGDVFVHDRALGTTTCVSVDPSGATGIGLSRTPHLSSDGRFVAFTSFVSTLVPGDVNGLSDVFVRDLVAGTTERVSVATDGSDGNNGFDDAQVTTNGRYVVLESFASNLTPNDGNGAWDVFVRDRAANAPVAFCPDEGAVLACPCGNDGAPGHGCASSVFALGSLLTCSGEASVGADTLVLRASSLSGQSCVFFQATQPAAPVVVDDGIGCVGGSVIRLGTRSVASGASSYPQAGDVPIGVRGQLAPAGGTRWYQAFYRNAAVAFCPPATSNRTNGLQIPWRP